ncbi:MAG: dicarboxylate/amino acid:cation symporter [Clostridium sp.]|uniref:dicarboxylate/amino acid:cation symporter n=1 Tax=Clostridium sp. TaxID=1506 RepID=UPI002FC75DC6
MKKMSFSARIFTGLILGVVLGLVINTFHFDGFLRSVISPIGAIFLNLMKMVIVPLILATLINSITGVGDMNRLGFLGRKALTYYIGSTLIAASIAITLAMLIKPGVGINMPIPQGQVTEASSIAKLIVDIVPSNPIKALAEGNTLQIIVFGAFIGIAINIIGTKVDNVKQLFVSFAEIMYRIVGIIMRVAPIAVFALITEVVATNGSAIIFTLFKLVMVILLGCLIQVIVVFSIAIRTVGKMSPVKFFKEILPAQIFSFSTASSAATLPISMKCVQEGIGISKTVSNFVLNLGSTVNMNGGAIYQATCAIFISQIYGVELSFPQLIIVMITAGLASIGAAAIPGTVIVMMTMVLSAVGLPLEAIALIAGVDRILDMITTPVNVTGDLVACVVVSAQEKKKNLKNEIK